MLSNRRHRTATSSAEPKKPNQNGAVIPYALASRPPIGGADDEATDERDPVDGGHPAEQLVGDGALSHGLRRGAPHEFVSAEHGQRAERRRSLTS